MSRSPFGYLYYWTDGGHTYSPVEFCVAFCGGYTSFIRLRVSLTGRKAVDGYKSVKTRMRKLIIKLAQEPRDFVETARLSALIGFSVWLMWAVVFSFLYAGFKNLPVSQVFPFALKSGALIGVVMAVATSFISVSVRATVQFSDKKDFVARLNMATSQLGHVAVSGKGDFLTFRPSFKTGGVCCGMVAVQLEDDHAVFVGPKKHVKRILERLEAV